MQVIELFRRKGYARFSSECEILSGDAFSLIDIRSQESTMIPIQFNYGKAKGELRSVMDFDLPYAYHDLNCVSRGEVRSTWKTALWVNFFMAAVSSAIGIGIWIAYQYDPFAQLTSLFAKFILGLIGVLFSAVSLLLALFSLTRGRLVLDRDSRELFFYRFWFSFRPHRRLRVDDLKALSWRKFDSPGDNDDPGHTYQVLVAELRDGRFVSIAIDSPPSIEIELKQAMGQTEVVKRENRSAL